MLDAYRLTELVKIRVGVSIEKIRRELVKKLRYEFVKKYRSRKNF